MIAAANKEMINYNEKTGEIVRLSACQRLRSTGLNVD